MVNNFLFKARTCAAIGKIIFNNIFHKKLSKMLVKSKISNLLLYVILMFFSSSCDKNCPEAVETSPKIISPCDMTYSNFPRTTKLEWSLVSNASSYTVEIDCFHCCSTNQWCTDVGRTFKVVPNIQNTYYVFDFVGAQPGRWRVKANKTDGSTSPVSPWCYFKYTQ